MGASLSTMGLVHLEMEEVLSKQTLLGLVFAVPLFISYFMTIRDYHVHGKSLEKESQSVIESQEMISDPMSPSHASLCDSDSSVTTAQPLNNCTKVTSTTEYLECLAECLMAKSKSAGHSDKNGISAALYQLGEILYNKKKYELSREVLQKTERLQKQIIHETLQAVASAMHQQGVYYMENGDEQCGAIYLEIVAQLKEDPSPSSLNEAWAVHSEYKPRHRKDADLAPHLKKVERRLKRASEEVKPLVKTLKLEARCVAHGRTMNKHV